MPKIFFASDYHFDHANIIKYCNRPFNSVKEMNRVLLKNFNNVVGKKDIVYFLGNLAAGEHSRSTDYWRKKLNGRIIFIKGNHDRSRNIKFRYIVRLGFQGGFRFMIMHDPERRNRFFRGYTIHGHVHNNYVIDYPLINRDKRTINVSCEMTNYKPISIKQIIQLIKTGYYK